MFLNYLPGTRTGTLLKVLMNGYMSIKENISVQLVSLKRKFVYNLERFASWLLYRVLFRPGVFLPKRLIKFFCSWEICQRKKDIPVSREVWDSQYMAGRWDYMAQLRELNRYSVIIGYLQHLKIGGSILDVGCGEGNLLKRLCPEWYSKYLGIDISQVAIEKACQKVNEKSVFINDDAERYEPKEMFDVIIFNESLYYFYNPVKTVENYVSMLNADGIIIISTFSNSKRAMTILKKIKDIYFLLDETQTTNNSRTWLCSVLLKNGADRLL